jgi:SecD/SecF fusion protein
MEKQKRWQLYLILAVLVITLYNILPTVFYYSKPLGSPIDAARAKNVAEDISLRVDSLEGDAVKWVEAFSKLLGIKPESVDFQEQSPRFITVTFKNAADANKFRRFLPTAGALIPFVPSQLKPYSGNENPLQVVIERNISMHISPEDVDEFFAFSWKFTEDGKVTPLYKELIFDRVMEITSDVAGESPLAKRIESVDSSNVSSDDQLLSIARDIVEINRTFGNDHPFVKRYYSSFTQDNRLDKEGTFSQFLAKLETLKTKIKQEIEALKAENQKLKDEGKFLELAKTQQLTLLSSQQGTLEAALGILKSNSEAFKAGSKPLSRQAILDKLNQGIQQINSRDYVQTLDLTGYHPFIKEIKIDWTDGYVDLILYKDLDTILTSSDKTESTAISKERLNQLIINEIARIARSSDEMIAPNAYNYRIILDQLTDSKSFLALKLGSVAKKQSSQIQDSLQNNWNPNHTDLQRSSFPIRSYADFKKESPEEQKLGLVVYAPSLEVAPTPEGFRSNSIYVIARGLDPILRRLQDSGSSQASQAIVEDFKQLHHLLQQQGFIGYSGAAFGVAPEFQKDFIFELSDYYADLLKATREDFVVKGSKKYATLEFTDVAQRILAQNRIDDRIQEDLLKSREAYSAAQVDLNVNTRYTVPPPIENPFWANLKLSFIKYFRGDDRKILKWGLDLSGGKTVRIGLKDKNGRTVNNPDDLKQAVNELYVRINNMGVAERTIRVEGDTIVLDFPGSQAFSATELVKAAAMYFHIVNEKFTPQSPEAEIANATNTFLQEVWNEAVVTNRKDIESINEIAWKHLGGGEEGGDEILYPRSEHARILYQNGLRLADPRHSSISSAFNDTESSVAMFRGDEFTEWHNQTHPLLFVFRNYALEGSNLENIQVGYDPSEGNMLMFGVKRSYDGAKNQNQGSPRDDFSAWTAPFAADRVAGTPKEMYNQGNGWRMAVILNGKVVTSPVLRAALRDGGTITGRFSQREINQLAADLKAGSLSFTPRILSEQNVSPELGKEERMKGIMSSVIALSLIVIAMVSYYRFAGVVASCAVIINLLIIWGVLQSIGAALTLPGIAGIVLAIAIAVDANVLVFERFREEFAISGRISSAMQAAYRKAFSAILDSNITTLMAAFILTQFDSGPIKGFAIVLIIGIISSMFTALFLTRFFFAGWVQNPKNKTLNMAHFIGKTNFDFLSKARAAIILSVVVIVIGTYLLISQRHTIFGMDFTGGYSLAIELQEQPNVDYREEAIKALLASGAAQNDIQVRTLSRPNQLRIQLGMSMEEPGHPFHGMPQEKPESKYTFGFEKNPRIVWVVNALAEKSLHINSAQLTDLDKNWTVMSGQLSDTMRNNALIALSLALIGILIYITIRFEFKYAIGAVVGLVHDVLITLGIAAMFAKLGFPVQIDLQVVGAIMTIIGYSLNDTIIVFDRIREEIKTLRKWKFEDIINHALNVTLSRTMMTSGITLLVLLSLVFFGGTSIFGFSLVMTIGVIVGTLSSLFIASPVMLYFHRREEKREMIQNEQA